MLNLAQVRSQIKSGDTTRAVRNAGHWLNINEAYRALKTLGWACFNGELHPVDRVPVFRLGSASIRRDRTTPGGWVVEALGGSYRSQADLAEITTEVESMLSEVEAAQAPEPETEAPPAKPSSAAQVAQCLAVEYPEHAERVRRALELVETGQVDPARYRTTYDPATFYGRYECECPDSKNRQPRTKFGAACKHALAMEISRLVEADRRAVAYRKLADTIERSRARLAETQAGYEAALRPDANNLTQRARYQFRGVGHL